MYDTLVNIQSGPRVLGQTFTMHAVEGTKHPLLDRLSAFSSGFGGDPNNFAKLDFSKGKLYEFSGASAATGSTPTTTCWGARTTPDRRSLRIG